MSRGAARRKYVSLRRLFTFLERSIGKGKQRVVFEPSGGSPAPGD